jgi:adenylate cyclase
MPEEACEIGILFADVAGSTNLYREFGDRVAFQVIEDTLQAIKAITEAHQGEVVKTIGDEVMVAFADPIHMFDAAVEIQQKNDLVAPVARDDGASRKVQLRLGLHFGQALRTGNDYFGNSVNLAARMVEIAAGGEIITTGALSEKLPAFRRGSLRRVGAVAVKGVEDTVTIAEILWQAGAELTILPVKMQTSAKALNGAPRLELTHAGGRATFEPDCGPITIGRETGNTIVVTDHRASRRHATINRRRGTWVLTDHSTNGSYVTFSGDREIQLHRQDIVLHGIGTICLGAGREGAGHDVIRFAVVFD